MAEIVLKATLLVLVGVVAHAWRNPSGRAVVWSALLGALLCLPAIVAWLPGPIVGWVPAGLAASPIHLRPESAASVRGAAPAAAPWATVLVGLYLAGVALGLARLGVGLWRAGQLRRGGRPMDPEWVEAWRRRLGVHGPVAVAESDRVGAPSLIGWRRPTVLVPRGHLEEDDPYLDGVMAHELAHIRRGDLLWNLLGQLALCLYWFHPLVHLVRRWWRHDSERACDDWAAYLLGDRRGYGRTLLAVASMGAQLGAVVRLDMARVGHLLGRVERLLRARGEVLRPRVGRLRAASAVGAVCLLAGCLGGLHQSGGAVTADIRADGRVLLNGLEVPIAQLEATAARLHRETGVSFITLKVDSAAAMGMVAQVQRAVAQGGFVDQRTIDTAQRGSGPSPDRPSLRVELYGDGGLRVDGQGLDPGNFAATAVEVHERTGATMIIILCHEGTRSATVRKVMDTARRAGFVDQVICDEGDQGNRSEGPP
ncbi:MAG: M56 family metallopeptidase [Candidatus Latescibacterota bacterium]